MKKHSSTAMLVLVFFVGLAILLYPSVSDWWNTQHQTRAIINYDTQVQAMSDKDCDKLIEAAHNYNARLAAQPYPFMYCDKVEGYEDVLNPNGTGMMGYVSIRKIDVELPIYHGISPSVLNIAVGHVKGSSLPVGGVGTHAVLSAHRGLPSAKLFSNLDKLEVKDTLSITILNRILTYEVDQILIVEPDEIDALSTQAGKDLCTLVTCTPYGINSHRLLVRGHRIDNPKGLYASRVAADAIQIEPVTIAPFVASPMLVVLLVVLLVKYRKRA